MKDKRSAKDPITTYTVQGFLVNYNLRFMIKHCQAACSVTDEFEFLDPDIRMPGMVLGTENFDKFHVVVNAIDAVYDKLQYQIMYYWYKVIEHIS